MLRRRSSIFYSWLVSYALILIIPIVISNIVYIEMNKTFQNEINHANQTMIEHVRNSIDNNLKDVNKLVTEFDLNPRIQSLLSIDRHMNGVYKYNIYSTVQDLKMYTVTNSVISDFYIYLRDSNMIVTSKNSTDCETFYEANYSGSTLSYNEWFDTISRPYSGSYIPMLAQSPYNDFYNGIAYVKSLPMLEKQYPQATVVIMFNPDFFKDAISNIKWIDGASALILNEKNQTMDSTDNIDRYLLRSPDAGTSRIGIAYDDLTGISGIQNNEINGKKVTVVYIKSEFSDWKYLYVVPFNAFRTKSVYIRNIAIIGIIICFAFGGIAAYLLLNKNYRPLSTLIKNIGSTAGMDLNKKIGEYDFIQEALSKTLREKNTIEQRLDKDKEMQKTFFLAKLLKGKAEGKSYIYDSLSYFDIQLYSEYFCVIAFSADNLSAMFFNADEIDDYEKEKLAYFIIKNVMEELAGQSNQGFVTEVDDRIVCLVNFCERNISGERDEMLFMITQAQAFIKSNFNIDITASVSNVHATFIGAATAYQEALQAMEYKFVIGNSTKIMFYDDIAKDSLLPTYYYPLETELQMINYLKVGDFKSAKSLLADIFTRNVSIEEKSVDTLRCLVFDVIGTILRTADEINVLYQGAYKPEKDMIESIEKSGTIEEMQLKILSQFKEICELSKEQRQSKSRLSNLISNAAEYIGNNYSNENLSISMIADEFKISADYLSGLFKEYTGDTMLDYIGKRRVDRAKELLRNDDMTVAEVAKATGYSSVNTFIRNFKKYEGITPGKYKTI